MMLSIFYFSLFKVGVKIRFVTLGSRFLPLERLDSRSCINICISLTYFVVYEYNNCQRFSWCQVWKNATCIVLSIKGTVTNIEEINWIINTTFIFRGETLKYSTKCLKRCGAIIIIRGGEVFNALKCHFSLSQSRRILLLNHTRNLVPP